MAKVIGQNIPAFLYDQYKDILTLAVPHNLVKYGDYVRVLPSWREKLYVFQSQEYKKIPPGRLAVWVAFKQACECWWKQKEEGECWPPDIGPREMIYWRMEADYWRMGIFQFYMHKSIRPFYRTGTTDWCRYGPKRDTCTDNFNPDENFGELPFFRVGRIYHDRLFNGFIMKGPDEVQHNYLSIYVPWVGTGGDYREPLIAVYNINRNFINEMTMTWNNQPKFYDLLTWKYITGTGWYNFYVGTDYNAVGFCLHDWFDYWPEFKYHVYFSSMQEPIESLRPFFFTV